MPSTFTDNLRIILQATGENDGTWGTLTNDSALVLIDTAIAGVSTKDLSGSGDYSLTVSNGATDEARSFTLKLSGIFTADRNLIVPSVEKVYIVDTTGITYGGFDLTVKTSGGVGVTFDGITKTKALVYCDGTDVYEISSDRAENLAALAYLDTVDTAQIDDDAITTVKVLDEAITNAKLADVAEATFKGRQELVGTGVPVDLTPAEARAVLSLEDADVNTLVESYLASNNRVCNAWVTFEVSATGGTITINDSHNVTDVTYNDVGDFTINFTNAFANADYSFALSAKAKNSGFPFSQLAVVHETTLPATTSFPLRVGNASNGTTPADPPLVTASFIGALA